MALPDLFEEGDLTQRQVDTVLQAVPPYFAQAVLARSSGGGPPDTAHLAVDVASWADEEGHWGQMTGSRSFVGLFSEADIDKAKRLLSYVPLVAFGEGLRRTVEFFKGAA